MKTIPEVKLKDGELIGWAEFENWALCNLPEWRQGNHLAGTGQCTYVQAIKAVAYLLTIKTQELTVASIALEQIAPKKVRLPDGKVMVYRCPDELIPVKDLRHG